MQFDPTSAKHVYAEKESDELIRIAFLEDAYVEGAKALAKEELAKRGFNSVGREEIERVRHEIELRRQAQEELQMQGLETEEEIPSWRQSVRLRIAPYRVVLSFVAIGLSGLFWLNSILGWGILGVGERQSRGIALLPVLLWLVFVAPTRREFREHSADAERSRKAA